MATKKNSSYEIGYGRPPAHARFKPGQSGNPRGRPKNETSFDSALSKALTAKVRLRENGKDRVVTAFEAVAIRLVTDAIHGKAPALKMLVALAGRTQSKTPDAAPAEGVDAVAALRAKIHLMAKRMRETSTPGEE